MTFTALDLLQYKQAQFPPFRVQLPDSTIFEVNVRENAMDERVNLYIFRFITKHDLCGSLNCSLYVIMGLYVLFWFNFFLLKEKTKVSMSMQPRRTLFLSQMLDSTPLFININQITPMFNNRINCSADYEFNYN